MKGMGTVQKEMPHKCSPWQNWKGLQCYPACGWHCCKQTRARFLPREWMYVVSILSTLKSWDSFLKSVKGNDQKKKEAKETGTCIQLKCPPAPLREAHSVTTNGKEPELPEPIPYEVTAWISGGKKTSVPLKKKRLHLFHIYLLEIQEIQKRYNSHYTKGKNLTRKTT